MKEFFTIVGPEDRNDPKSKIIAQGCVSRNLAHGPARIPHAAVHVIPVRCRTGRVLIHQRSNIPRNSPGMWDFFGGHVSFEMGILLSSGGLKEASEHTALLEAREELLMAVDSKPWLILKPHLQQIGRVGEFRWGIDDSNEYNVEYSTAFALCVPESARIISPFELHDGGVEWLRIEELSWDDLLILYQESRAQTISASLLGDKFRGFFSTEGEFKGFADGATRILERVLAFPDTRQEIEEKLSWCKHQII